MSAFFASASGPYLALYLVTLALHAAFVSYLVGGAGYVLVGSVRARRAAAPPRDRSPLVTHIGSWLPLTMGAAITAGVAPLLFLQLLHQRAFYTANLLLGPIWFAMIPALIVGFYLLYLHKSRPAFHPGAVLGVALACFAVVACLWSWNHRVMTTPESWTAAYRDSVPATYGASWLARFPLWLGAMLAQFATVAAWQATRLRAGGAVGTLAAVALGGRALSVAGACLLGWQHQLGEPLTTALVVVVAAEAAGWLALAARQRRGELPSRRALALLTAATGLALALAVLVREQARLPQLRRLPAAVHDAGGAWLFALFAALALVAFALIFRAVRNAAPEEPPAP